MEIVQVNQAEMLSAINKSEVDMQISTAKAYPRDVKAALERIAEIATLDQETASDCFYVLHRNGASGQVTIEGLSVRMAEIIAGAWGNLRVQARVIGNDGKTITAQAVCHDLETNFAVSVEVKRRITDKNGRTYSEDLQTTTGNAACAIAFRNAVLKVVPKAVTKKVINNVKEVAIGKALDVETSRQNCIANFAKLGVSTDMICSYLDIKSVEDIGKNELFTLRGAWNAIKEGTTSVKETFVQPQEEKKIAEKAKTKAQGAKEKAQQAIARQKQDNATGDDLVLNNEK